MLFAMLRNRRILGGTRQVFLRPFHLILFLQINPINVILLAITITSIVIATIGVGIRVMKERHASVLTAP